MSLRQSLDKVPSASSLPYALGVYLLLGSIPAHAGRVIDNFDGYQDVTTSQSRPQCPHLHFPQQNKDLSWKCVSFIPHASANCDTQDVTVSFDGKIKNTTLTKCTGLLGWEDEEKE